MRCVLLAIAALIISGCARTSSTTTVHDDGSWSRSVKLVVGKDMNGQFTSPFVAPTGARWKITEQTKEDEKTTTVTTDGKLGESPLTDIIFKGKKATLLKNYITVREIEPGVYEYYEKFVNPNPDGKGYQKQMEELKKMLQKSLPTGITLTDAQYAGIGKQLNTDIMRVMFGPDDHLIGGFLLNPEGTVHRLRMKIAGKLDKALEVNAPALSFDQRKATVLSMMRDFDQQVLDSQKPKKDDPNAADSNGDFVGLSVSVKLPGELVSTNGEIDPYTGEVFWDFLSMSADPEALELRATCRVKK